MGLFDKLGGNQKPQQNQGPSYQQFASEPVKYLRQAGLDIPDGLNTPQQITQYIMQSGQLTQNRAAQAMQMMGRMRM